MGTGAGMVADGVAQKTGRAAARGVVAANTAVANANTAVANGAQKAVANGAAQLNAVRAKLAAKMGK